MAGAAQQQLEPASPAGSALHFRNLLRWTPGGSVSAGGYGTGTLGAGSTRSSGSPLLSRSNASLAPAAAGLGEQGANDTNSEDELQAEKENTQRLLAALVAVRSPRRGTGHHHRGHPSWSSAGTGVVSSIDAAGSGRLLPSGMSTQQPRRSVEVPLNIPAGRTPYGSGPDSPALLSPAASFGRLVMRHICPLSALLGYESASPQCQ